MARCNQPFRLKSGNKDLVPCGKCHQCKARRAATWSIRLRKELESSPGKAAFLTLTYDDEHEIITPENWLTLWKPDVQAFIKKLRKSQKGKIRYYACGEYGTKYKRPHYHLIIFGLEKVDICLYEKLWEKGRCHIGEVNEATIGYTLKYLQKPGRVPITANDDRVCEFSLMSKKMGMSYLTNMMIKWHRDDLKRRYYVPLPDGKKAPMPRYYADKIYTKAQRRYIGEFLQKIEQESYDGLNYDEKIAKFEKENGIKAEKQKAHERKQQRDDGRF